MKAYGWIRDIAPLILNFITVWWWVTWHILSKSLWLRIRVTKKLITISLLCVELYESKIFVTYAFCHLVCTFLTPAFISTVTDQSSRTLCNWPLQPHDLLFPPLPSLGFNCSLGNPINRLWSYVSIDYLAVTTMLFHCRQHSVGNHVGQIPCEGASIVSCNVLLLRNIIGGGQVTLGVKKSHVSRTSVHINSWREVVFLNTRRCTKSGYSVC